MRPVNLTPEDFCPQNKIGQGVGKFGRRESEKTRLPSVCLGDIAFNHTTSTQAGLHR
jgi:hypothetical protein